MANDTARSICDACPLMFLSIDDEVDFILRKNKSVVAIEIKSNAEKRTDGLDKFKELLSIQMHNP